MKEGYVYILSNFSRSTLYIGVTNNLIRRVMEHKESKIPGFTKKYKCKYLMYYEYFGNIEDAISREKQLKNWHRDWKVNLIKGLNKQMRDLSEDFFEDNSE